VSRRLAGSPDASLIGPLVVLVAASLFGLNGVLARAAYALGMVPLTFVVWRAAVGAVGVAIVGGWLRRRGGPAVALAGVPRRERLALGLAVVMGSTVNLAIFFAFERIPIALALLCFYMYPAMVAAVGVATGLEPLDRVRGVALGLSLAGMIGVVAGGAPTVGSALDILGIVGALGAAASQTAFVVVSRAGYRSVPTEQAMGLILGGSAVLSAGLAFAVGAAGGLALPVLAPELLPLLVFTGLACATIPSLLFLTGIRLIGGTRTGILMLIEPVVGVALAAALLAEAVTPLQVVGGLAILVAAALLTRAGTREAAAAEARADEAVAALRVPGGP